MQSTPTAAASLAGKLRAVIFDLDGLLIDSEPIWKETEIEILGALGVPLTWEMTHQTMGMRMIEVAHFWRERYPWNGPSEAEVEKQVVDEVIRRLSRDGRALPCAREAIEAVRRAGLRCAVATSSPLRLAQSVLQALSFAPLFEAIVSAELEQFGKPHPAVFLSAAQRVNTAVEQCLVLEDSVNGVIAARAARMRCIAVPSPELAADPRFALADVRLSSLCEFPALLAELTANGG